MNKYTKNLNRIEFTVTNACTGRCKHCSEGDHINDGIKLNGDIAAEVVRKVCESYKIESMMTFGGEPLLCPETIYKAHAAAKEAGIPKRQVITNGYFTRDEKKIDEVVIKLKESGVNDILLSVDAFHQETIPVEPVKYFASTAVKYGVPIRLSPAWLVSREDMNPYNVKTREIVEEFKELGVPESGGNVIFPEGNALIYLSDYFEDEKIPENPYKEDPENICTVSIDSKGDVLGENIYKTDIMEIIESYTPDKFK